MNYSALLNEESATFDNQINTRVQNGHVPDLRTTKRCEWFYNNPWRDPFFANLTFGTTVSQILNSIDKYVHKKKKQSIKILEIACGPGHICLELARAGHQVTGIDISKEAIKIAAKTAKNDPLIKSNKGRLTYIVCNFFEFNPTENYDLIIFSRALHHFPNIPLVLNRVSHLLYTEGIIFVADCPRIRYTDSDAAVIHLVKGLLSITDAFYEKEALPKNSLELQEKLESIKNKINYKNSSGKNTQSPMDNEATFEDMHPNLMHYFDELELDHDYGFFDQIIGGLRLNTIELEHKVAKWLQLVDQFLCQNNHISSELFHFIGRKKPNAK